MESVLATTRGKYNVLVRKHQALNMVGEEGWYEFLTRRLMDEVVTPVLWPLVTGGQNHGV